MRGGVDARDGACIASGATGGPVDQATDCAPGGQRLSLGSWLAERVSFIDRLSCIESALIGALSVMTYRTH